MKLEEWDVCKCNDTYFIWIGDDVLYLIDNYDEGKSEAENRAVLSCHCANKSKFQEKKLREFKGAKDSIDVIMSLSNEQIAMTAFEGMCMNYLRFHVAEPIAFRTKEVCSF